MGGAAVVRLWGARVGVGLVQVKKFSVEKTNSIAGTTQNYAHRKADQPLDCGWRELSGSYLIDLKEVRGGVVFVRLSLALRRSAASPGFETNGRRSICGARAM